MSHAPWSLASRLTKLFAITTSALVLVTTLISAGYVSTSADRSVTGVLKEEINAMIAGYGTLAGDAKLLDDEARKFQEGHKEFKIAWRIWRSEGSAELLTLGQKDLFDHASLSTAAELRGEPQRFAKDLRGMVEVGRENMLFGCVIDASSSLAPLRHYGTIALILVIATIAIIFVVGHLLVGRVSRTLRQVAESARNVPAAGVEMQVDLRNAPREIREIVSALQEMMANVKSERERNRVFTASLAHELRSPIQNLMGETEVSLMTERNGSEYRRVLRSHLQELRDLADAVDNLVTICAHRSDEQDAPESRESFDLAPEAKLRLARESGYALARGVQLNLEAQGDTRLYGDREGLLRAMRNLTANAIEWSNPGDQVDVHVRGENGRVVVTVDDSGPGVPEELKARIFEPFFRGPQAKGRRIGYGLGLAIVRSAVDAQGGEVEISRSPKGGARFCMLLPRNLHLPAVEDTPLPT